MAAEALTRVAAEAHDLRRKYLSSKRINKILATMKDKGQERSRSTSENKWPTDDKSPQACALMHKQYGK